MRKLGKGFNSKGKIGRSIDVDFKANPVKLEFLGALFNFQWHFKQFCKNKSRRFLKFLNAISSAAEI
jgi:hypothetical protein